MKKNKKVGIWIDKRRAYLIEVLPAKAEIFNRIESSVDEFHVVGGSRSSVAWGPADTVSEGKYLEREKQQLRRFFEKITSTLKRNCEVYIFGPAESKFGLKKYIEEEKTKGIKIVNFSNADSMTENQMMAHAKDFFHQFLNEN